MRGFNFKSDFLKQDALSQQIARGSPLFERSVADEMAMGLNGGGDYDVMMIIIDDNNDRR